LAHSIEATREAPQIDGVATASPPLRIEYPAAHIDVNIHPLVPDDEAMASRSLVPPGTMDGYWLESFGSPGTGSTDTTYIVGHSWLGRDAPFNRLSTAAGPGDTFTVTTATGKLVYRVDSVTDYSKQTLRDSDIWAVAPNKLVLISCHLGDPFGTNVVVKASPLSPVTG
jgi:hypothetical protein